MCHQVCGLIHTLFLRGVCVAAPELLVTHALPQHCTSCIVAEAVAVDLRAVDHYCCGGGLCLVEGARRRWGDGCLRTHVCVWSVGGWTKGFMLQHCRGSAVCLSSSGPVLHAP